MARGWESKSVEQQQEAVLSSPTRKKPLSPAAIAVQHEREGLQLARKRLLQQLETAVNPQYRKLLEQSLSALSEKLNLLG